MRDIRGDNFGEVQLLTGIIDVNADEIAGFVVIENDPFRHLVALNAGTSR